MITPKTLLALTLATSFACATSVSANMINITPSQDNTLYEFDPLEGDFSNALGFHFFAGETEMSELRRGVVAFDIAGHIPPGSTITAVTLSLNMSMTIDPTARTVELHKLLADWGEGTSIAPGGKARVHRLPRTTPHGGTVSSTPFFGLPKEAIFPPR